MDALNKDRALENGCSLIKERYRRFALIAHPRHLDALDSQDEDTVFVSCNWLVWQEAIAAGRHCVFIESEKASKELQDLANDLFVQSNDWIYVNGDDATLFCGVSLGRKFLREICYVILEHARLKSGLQALKERFNPSEIVYFDFRMEPSILDSTERLAMISRIVEPWGLRVVDRGDPLAGDDVYVPQSRAIIHSLSLRQPTRERIKSFLTDGFETVITWLSRRRRNFGRPRKSVLMVVTHMNGTPLIEAFDRTDVFALFLARWFPNKKKLLSLTKCLAKGVLPISEPYRTPADEDLEAIKRIEDALEAAWAEPGTELDDAVRDYVRGHILEPGRLSSMAGQVRWAEAVLARYRPDVIVTDGLQNPLSTTFFELAKNRGLATAATWHSHYLDNVKQPMFGCDPRTESVADYCLTWGKTHEDWLHAIQAKCKSIRTGSVVADTNRPRNPLRPGGRRVLVLQYAVPVYDTLWPQGGQYPFFVETVRMLDDLGYHEVRLKLHPGTFSLGHYRKIAGYFGLKCEIFIGNDFEDHMAWADLVIGPVHTGAMLKVLAAGKPYFPVLLPPHVIDVRRFDGANLYEDLDTLRQALADGVVLDQSTLFNNLTSQKDIPDPARRVWAHLGAMATGR